MKLVLYSTLLTYAVATVLDINLSNNFMNTVMNTIRQIAGYKTVHIPNFKVHYGRYGDMLVDVDIEYTDCIMTGLFHVRRHGDCSDGVQNGSTLIFTCAHAFEDIKFHYSGRISVGNVMKNEKFKFRVDFTPFLATTRFKTDIHRRSVKIDYYSLINNVRVNHKIYGLDDRPKDFVKAVTEGIIQHSMGIFLPALNTPYMPTYKRIVERTPIYHIGRFDKIE